MANKIGDNDFSLIFNDKNLTVREAHSGAIIRQSPRPSGVSDFIVFRYSDNDLEIDFMVKEEDVEQTFINKTTGKPYKRRVPARFIVGEATIAEFMNELGRTHRRQPTDRDIDHFKKMVTEGIPLIATYGNRHPENFPNGEVLFARHILPRA